MVRAIERELANTQFIPQGAATDLIPLGGSNTTWSTPFGKADVAGRAYHYEHDVDLGVALPLDREIGVDVIVQTLSMVDRQPGSGSRDVIYTQLKNRFPLSSNTTFEPYILCLADPRQSRGSVSEYWTINLVAEHLSAKEDRKHTATEDFCINRALRRPLTSDLPKVFSKERSRVQRFFYSRRAVDLQIDARIEELRSHLMEEGTQLSSQSLEHLREFVNAMGATVRPAITATDQGTLRAVWRKDREQVALHFIEKSKVNYVFFYLNGDEMVRDFGELTLSDIEDEINSRNLRRFLKHDR